MSPSVPRLPLVPDPLRRIRVPKDLDEVTAVGTEDDPADGGLTRDAVEKVWDSAKALYRSGVHPALQLCVRRHGAVVLDRAIGHARGNGPGADRDAEREPVTTRTPILTYSISKAITAVVVHLLDQRGDLHIGDPVAEHVPEYGRHGKERITIAQLLAHRAGVPNLDRSAMALETLGEREVLLEALYDARPSTRPGKLLSYHATSGGFVLGEVVHRVTGKDIRTVLQEEIAGPHGLGLSYGVPAGRVGEVARDELTGPPLLPPASTLLTRALGLPLDELVATTRDPRFLTGIVPAANVVTTAHELSRFFDLVRDGQVLEPRTLRRALTEQSYLEVDLSLGFPTRFSYGFMLGAKRLSLYGLDTDDAFGHLGFTNSLGWADPARGTAVGLLTTGKPTLYPEITRFWGLAHRISSETR
jgi:CubicO group peptidase (beta-lactamase class C family)